MGAMAEKSLFLRIIRLGILNFVKDCFNQIFFPPQRPEFSRCTGGAITTIQTINWEQ